jgi:uncharacterized protein YndB with AHSA1/START domain
MKHTLSVTTPSDLEIEFARTFNAPRHLVWKATTEPELVKRWFSGPEGRQMTVCEADIRVGGAFHRTWSGPDGATVSQRGVFRELDPPERMVRVESMEFGGVPQGGEKLATAVLSGSSGQTRLTITFRYPSTEARDADLARAKEGGIAAMYDRLEEIVLEMS